MKLEIAAGENPQRLEHGWLQHDARDLPGIDVVCDWKDLCDFHFPEYLDEIYCRHFIEHLSIEEVPEFLEMCSDLLERKGLLTVVTPNLKWLCKNYLDGGYVDSSEFSYWAFGAQTDGWDFHKCLFDCDLLCRLMVEARFEIAGVENGSYHLVVKGTKK